MAIIRDMAVVLGRLDYSETSQILVLFTRAHGKVRAIAKGIKRGTKARFAVGADLLDIGDVVIRHRQERSAALSTLTDWRQTRSLSGLREKLERIRAAEYVAEITGQLTEDFDPHADLFDALVKALLDISESMEPLRTAVAYQLQLLGGVGLLPRFDACMSCGRPGDLIYFSSLEGGMICRHCEPGQVEKWEVSAPSLEMINALLSGGRDGVPTPLEPARPLERVGASASTFAVFAVLNYHVAHLMGREPHLAARLVPAVRRRVVE